MTEAKQEHTYRWAMLDKEHPVWGIIKTMISIMSLALLLTFNASKFDSGEVRTLAIQGLLAVFLEGVKPRRK